MQLWARMTAMPFHKRLTSREEYMMKLELESITKFYGKYPALQNVSATLTEGVYGLLGPNGAGKSTLMNILGGVLQPDSGEILLDGKKMKFDSPAQSLDAGIAFIHQELNLMPNMSIRENIFLGRENRKARFFVDFQKTSELAKTYTDMVGLTADVNTLVKDLSIAQRQMVEVAKALSTNAKLIVMDEPTSSLTDRETEILMNVIRNLRDQGVTVVFISHRLSELFEISDRITVLRDGECVGTIDTKDCTEPQLVNMMVGRTLDDIYPKGNAQIGEAVLEAKHLNAGKMVQDVSFTLHRGEILGFAGLIGAGRSEVMRAIFGVDPLDSGEIIIDGVNVRDYSLKNLRDGVGMVLQKNVLFSGTIAQNLEWGDENATHDEIVSAAEKAQANGFVSAMKDGYDTVLDQGGTNVSGGQKQRLCIARALLKKPKILILDDSTSAVDTATESRIRTALKTDLAGTTKIIIAQRISSVMDADEIIVMSDGRITGIGKHDELIRSNEEYREIYISQTGKEVDA